MNVLAKFHSLIVFSNDDKVLILCKVFGIHTNVSANLAIQCCDCLTVMFLFSLNERVVESVRENVNEVTPLKLFLRCI